MSFSDTLADAILSMNSDAIIAADKEGIIRFWNPGAERIFGYASGTAIRQSLDIIIPERLRKRHFGTGIATSSRAVRAVTVMATSSRCPGSKRTAQGSPSSSRLCHCGTKPTN